MSSYEQLLLDSLDKRHQDEQFQRLFHAKTHKARVWLLGAHERANMGDMALTYTAEILLRKLYPSLEHITMSRSAATYNWQKLKALVAPEDLIFMPGGGNLGDLWLHEESFRRLVVKTFGNNPIVVLPQSVKFENSKEALRSAEIYKEHKQLLIFARDASSHAQLKELIGVEKTALAPDLVFSYEYPVPFLPQDKNKLLLIARGDKEQGSFPLKQWAENQKELNFTTTDTTYGDLEFHGTSFSAKSVYKKIDECHSSGVVVTNRLHGAIFALLAGRPVIAYENSYGKIAGALELLGEKVQDRIVFLNEPPTLDLISKLSSLDDSEIPPSLMLQNNFISLENKIRNFIQTPSAPMVY